MMLGRQKSTAQTSFCDRHGIMSNDGRSASARRSQIAVDEESQLLASLERKGTIREDNEEDGIAKADGDDPVESRTIRRDDDVSVYAYGESGESCPLSEGGGEEADFFLDNVPEVVQERDRLLHWWCQRELHRCLRKLARADRAGLFLEPVPWEDLEMDDYLDVVETPMDLKTIGERLDDAGYEDADGLTNPKLFWSDVALCWDNCMRYCRYDEQLEAYRMALEMADIAEHMEDAFWVALDACEHKMVKEVDPSIGGLVAAIDVAAGTVEEITAVAYDSIAKSLGGWLTVFEEEGGVPIKGEKKLTFGRDDILVFESDYDPDMLASPLDYQFYRAPPPPLRKHFGETVGIRQRFIVQKKLEDIDLQITSAIDAARKHVDEREEEADFDGIQHKIPLTKLFPGMTKSGAKAQHTTVTSGQSCVSTTSAKSKHSKASRPSNKERTSSDFGPVVSKDSQASEAWSRRLGRSNSNSSTQSTYPAVSHS